MLNTREGLNSRGGGWQFPADLINHGGWVAKFPQTYIHIYNELSNKRSEMISKCRHENKFLLANYKSKD